MPTSGADAMADVEMNTHSRLGRPAAPKYLAACVQAAPVAFDLRTTFEKAKDLAADAARQDAKLILFPEAFVSAYPRGASFGATIGARSAEGRELFRTMRPRSRFRGRRSMRSVRSPGRAGPIW